MDRKRKKIMQLVSGGAAQGPGGPAVIYIAAKNSHPIAKQNADFIGNQVDDEKLLTAAIVELNKHSVGGQVVAAAGTYTMSTTFSSAVDNIELVGQGYATVFSRAITLSGTHSYKKNLVANSSYFNEVASTTVTEFTIQGAAITTTNGLIMSDFNALTTGKIANLVSNSADVTARNLVQITNDNTLAVGAVPLSIQQDSTGNSVFIDHNGATGKALYIDSEGTTQTGGVVDVDVAVLTTGTALDIGNADLLTTGFIANLVSNAPDTSARVLVQITNDNTLATGAVPLALQNDSTSNSMFIDHNGITGKALYIDGQQTTQTAGIVDIDVDTLTTGTGIDMGNGDALTTGSLLVATSNSADTGTRSIALVKQDHSSASGATALEVWQDGAQPAIKVTGVPTSIGLDLSAVTGARKAIKFTAGTGCTAAPQTNAAIGFIRIDVGGTDQWLPYYNAT